MRQRWGVALWHAACGVGRLMHGVALVALTVATLAAAGAAVLAWRLSQGPLDVGWLARRAEEAMSPAAARSRVHIGEATLRWLGFHQGAGHGLELGLQDLRVVNRSGAAGAALGQADVSVSVGALLGGRAEPRSVVLTGLRLRLVRAADGSVTVDLGSLNEDDTGGPGPSMTEALAELGRPAGGESVLGMLAQLGRVRLKDATLELVDQQFDATLRADIGNLDLQRQPEGGVRGSAEGRFVLGGAEAALHLEADLVEGGGTRMRATLEPVGMTEIAGANAALSQLSALDASLRGTASLSLSPALRPVAAELQASAGAGRVRTHGAEVAFERLALDASAAWAGELRPDRLTIRRAQAVLASPAGRWSSTIGVSGEIKRADGLVQGDLSLTLDHADFADLPALWPKVWGGHTRPWLTDNVTAGTVRDGALHFVVQGPEDLSSFRVAEASGTLLGDDVTVHWLRPVPPMEHAQAVLTIRGPDVLEIAVPTARQGGVAVRDGLVRINGLSVKDQFMALSTDVVGPVAEVVGVLRHPRLHLLDRKPIYARTSAGTLTGRLTIDLPMEDHLQLEQVKIHAAGRLSGLRLGGLVAGRDLDRGEVQIDVTSDGLKANGTAAVAHIPATLTVEMDFRPGGPSQVVQRATAVARATPQQLAALGLDPGGAMGGGSGNFTATYTAHRDGQGDIKVQADLKDAALALAGWKKAPGQPAEAAAQVVLRDDRLVGVSGLQAQGPGMQVSGRAEMAGDRLGLLRLDRLVLGKTEAAGEIRFPAGEAIRARLAGPVLDLSDALARKPGRPAAAQRDAAWVADVRFDRVLLANGRSLGGVSAHVEHDGLLVRQLRADSAAPESVRAELVPQGNGRQLSLRAADAGAVLRALDLVDTVQGGTLTLDGHYDDRPAAPVLAGTLAISSFQLRDAPVLGKLLQAATVYGVVDALRGPGLLFSQFTLPFRYDGDVLEVQDARAFSVSLGITAQGKLDLARKTIDLKGTVVPAYVLNSMLGYLPLIGRVFSPEQGGGLLAVNYAVRGALADPAVSVNPLSALTPGFLRGLFKIFD